MLGCVLDILHNNSEEDAGSVRKHLALLTFTNRENVIRYIVDIEEGNFSDTLVEKIGSGGEDSKTNESSSHSSVAHSLTNNNLDLLKKLQMHQL